MGLKGFDIGLKGALVNYEINHGFGQIRARGLQGGHQDHRHARAGPQDGRGLRPGVQGLQQALLAFSTPPTK